MSDGSITETLPPAELLDCDMALIKAGIECMDSIEIVQEYVAYENAHQQRVPVLHQLHRRAQEIRAANEKEQSRRACLENRTYDGASTALSRAECWESISIVVADRTLWIPRKVEYMPEAVPSRSHPLDTMLAVSDIIRNRRYAEIYARILELGTPTVEEIATGLDSSSTTVYEDVNHLSEVGVLERVTDTQPHRYRARSIEMTVQEADETYEISPTLLVVLARTASNENLNLYLDRHGTAGLATAVQYAQDYVRGRTTARVMARDVDIPVLEAETILQELREVILDVEPDLENDPDIDELDAAVDESSE